MSYYLRHYNKNAQSFIYSGQLDTIQEAVETARKELHETDEVEVRKSGTNELATTVFKVKSEQYDQNNN